MRPVIAITCLLCAGAAQAADPFGALQPLSAEALDTLRGGYTAGDGLVVRIGIERVAYVDGAVVAVNRWTLDDPRAAAAIATTVPGLASTVATAPMVLQNSLDNQHLQTVTTVDVVSNALSQLRALNLGEALRGAQVGSLPH